MSRRIMRLFVPYRGRVALAALAILVTSSIGVANPLLIQRVFDQALFCGPSCPDLPLLYKLVALMVALPVVAALIGVGQTFLTNWVGQRVMQDLRDRLYRHLQRMSLRFFTATRTGEIQSRLANDVGGVQEVVTSTAGTIVANVVIVITTLIAMVILSWPLTVLSVALVPVFLLVVHRVGETRKRVAVRAQESKAEMTAMTEETLSVSGVLLTKVFGRLDDEAARFRGENRTLARLAVRQVMVGQTFFALIQAFFAILPAACYLIAGLALHHSWGTISAGTLVAFTTLQSRLFFPVGQMLQVVVEVQTSLGLFQRIFEYLDLPHDIVDAPGARALASATARGRVELRNVSFRYDEAVAPALDGVSLTVDPGQMAAIVGPSGAGKTTISYLVPRLYDVDAGAVLVDGVDVRDVTQASLGGLVGMVTQETFLFHATVRANLLYARPDATQSELEAAARAANIHDRIMALENGYDTVVGERGYRLSGGEKQRLAIARVVLKNPPILILDESTSALDTAGERTVQAALRPLMRGRTTIAIAHRLSTVVAADVIFVIDRGRVAERGTHAELLARGGIYAGLYAAQGEAVAESAGCAACAAG